MDRNAVLLVYAMMLLNGCKPNVHSNSPSAAPAVPVSVPVQRDVTEFVEYTGRTDALETVNIKARVTGYITSAPPTELEGTEIAQGKLLFTIDKGPYKAQLDQAEALERVAVAQAELARAIDRHLFNFM